MRIVSWNVNGFRSVAKQGFVDWFRREDPDVLNLQEIRAEWDQIDAPTRRALEERHEVVWFPAQSKKGYAGSATLTRKGLPLAHEKGLGITDYDVEGRFVVSKHQAFTLIAGYFPNASQGLVRLPFKRQFSRDLSARIKQHHDRGERLVIVGDMNVAPEEIDLANPASNRMTAGFTDEEREDFRGYLAEGVHDVFRERNPGKKGLYTWWSARGGARGRNVGWRLDIFLVSKALVPHVRDVKIHPEVTGSDHCPISLELEV